MTTPRPARTLRVFALVMITVGTITSIQSAPSMAEWGFALVFIYLVVALVFLIPSALISAELATGWPADGGVYVWVREAFGPRWGFLAVFEQWSENAIWFPSILQITVITGAYVWAPDWQHNRLYVFVAVNALFWLLTVLNLRGMRTSALVATAGTLGGRVVPVVAICGLALAYLLRGDPSQIRFDTTTFVPDLADWGHLSFIVGAFLTFAGIEASSSNAGSARNPRRDYPIAIITSAAIAVVLVTAVGLAIAVVVPPHELSLVAGLMQAITRLLARFGLDWLLPVIAGLIALGMIGEVNNWIPGPTRGLLVAGREGALPRFFQKENDRAVHARILVSQGVFVTAMSSLTLGFDVQSAFWLMTVLPTVLYLVMYMLMFAAGIKLRYTQPEVERSYRVPLGNAGMWILAGVGIVAALVAIPVGFIPPSTVEGDARLAYFAVVAVGSILMLAFPLALWHGRRPDWQTADPGEALLGDT